MALFTTTLGLYDGVLWSGELQGFIIHEMMPTGGPAPLGCWPPAAVLRLALAQHPAPGTQALQLQPQPQPRGGDTRIRFSRRRSRQCQIGFALGKRRATSCSVLPRALWSGGLGGDRDPVRGPVLDWARRIPPDLATYRDQPTYFHGCIDMLRHDQACVATTGTTAMDYGQVAGHGFTFRRTGTPAPVPGPFPGQRPLYAQ
jgi:hypothetical protein